MKQELNRRAGMAANPAYTEIKRLDKMLAEAGIPHTFLPMYDGWQVCYPTEDDDRLCDAMQHLGSYGHNDNKLETLGLSTLAEAEENGGDIIGWQTAEQVFKRMSDHYNGHKGGTDDE